MKKIYKYVFEPDSLLDDIYVINIEMPYGAKIIKAAVQGDLCCLWAEVNPENKNVERSIYSIGTDHGIVPEGAKYLDTIQIRGYVFHIYIPRDNLNECN